jgi:spermidine synthase
MAKANAQSAPQIFEKTNSFLFGVMLILFFLSGVSALIYQIVWIQMAGLVFGVAPFAAATILSSFMAGLTLGSLFWGRIADKVGRSLILFAFLEIGIGISAYFFPVALSSVLTSYTHIYLSFSTDFYLLSLFRYLIVFALLFVPTFLMGGTLPVLTRLNVQNLAVLGRKVGKLYSVNNLGAAAGCFLASFFLIRIIGLSNSTYFAMALNFLIGGVAFALHASPLKVFKGHNPINRKSTRRPALTENKNEDSSNCTHDRKLIIFLLLVFAISGFISMVYAVSWIRMLSALTLSNSVYSFSTVSIALLLGASFGSFIYAKFLHQKGDQLALFGMVQSGIGISALFLLPAFNNLPSIIRETFPLVFSSEPSWSMCIVSEFVPTFLLIVVPATLMGITFPLMSAIYARNLKKIGKKIGLVNSLDTVGAIFGSFVAGFVLIPLLGLQTTVVVLSLFTIVMGGIVVYVNPDGSRRLKQGCIGILATSIVISYIFIPFRFDFWRNDLGPMEELLYYNEGVGGTTTVREYLQVNDLTRVLEIDGTNVAGTSYMLKSTQKQQGHLPLLLHKNPKKVLIVGFGSGGTTYSVSKHNVDKIVAVELVPDVIDAAEKHFEEVNHGVMNDPKVHIRIGDGRNFVLTTQETYDVILTESVHPIYSGNGSLYSLEYFQRCKEILNEGGVMSVWIPLWALPEHYFKMIIESFSKVFQQATLWYAPNCLNRQILLIGCNGDFKIDFHSLNTRLSQEDVARDLEEIGLNDPFLLLSSFMCGPKALKKYSSGTDINSDDRPLLQYFTYPYLAFSDTASFNTKPVYENLFSVMRFRKYDELAALLTKLGSTEMKIKENKSALSTYFESTKHTMNGVVRSLQSNQIEAIKEYFSALEINPNDTSAQYLLNMSLEFIYVSQGNELQAEGNIENAIPLYKKALALNPKSTSALYNLSLADWKMGRDDKAKLGLKRILRINPKMRIAQEILDKIGDS